MWRFLFIGGLVAHGLVHLAIWLMPQPADGKAPFDVNHSWLVGDQKATAIVLAFSAAAFLVVGGGALWAHADWWRTVAVIGLALSFGLIVVFFNPWYAFIEAVNAAVIVAIVWLAWPTRSMVGA